VVCAQTIAKVDIEILSVQPAKLRVSLDSEKPLKEWSFRNTYGPITGLADRIENVQAIDSKGEPIRLTKLTSGQYQTQKPVRRFTYDVVVNLTARRSDLSHVSWLMEDRGLLMLADLLPQSIANERIQLKLTLPATWNVVSGLFPSNGDYWIVNPDKAVFLISHSLRVYVGKVRGRQFRVAVTGQWQTQGRNLLKEVNRVVEECVRLTDTNVPEGAVLMLLPLEAEANTWTAETRGNNIVLLLSPNEPRAQLLSRLQVILAHEALHLWVPGALNLQGDYDWFFEGFTLYQALIAALRLKLIDFDEYLKTLARVYDSYLLAAERDRFSLLQLSETRWTSSSHLVYDKGVLVAFIYDLNLRSLTKSRSNLSSLYPKLFRKTDGPADANEVIIRLLDQPVELREFSSTFITRPQSIDLKLLLSRYGINVERSGFETRLTVKNDLENSQRKVLKSLGYRK
jgi:predicted metalloprotease with PDZ domain